MSVINTNINTMINQTGLNKTQGSGQENKINNGNQPSAPKLSSNASQNAVSIIESRFGTTNPANVGKDISSAATSPGSSAAKSFETIMNLK